MKVSNRTALAFLLCFFYSQTVVAQDCNMSVPLDEYKKCLDAWLAKEDAKRWKEQEDHMLGKYFCVIEHVAGIQKHEKQGEPPSVGSIRLPSDKFFLEIFRDDHPINCDVMNGFFPRRNCKTIYRMRAKQNPLIGDSADGYGYSAGAPDSFVFTAGQFRIWNAPDGSHFDS
jgi:hypothetical protein